MVDFYKPILPLIVIGMKSTQTRHIIDLYSGGGGAIEQIQRELYRKEAMDVQITLTDKYPNTGAYALIAARTNGAIGFHAAAVDAADVPSTLKGFRTIFSGFHHFDQKLGKAVLKNAVDAREGIGIFDGGNKNILAIIAILVFHPLIFLFFSPFFKPFRWSRLFFTYLVPIIPFCTVWDGIVSIIRLYKPDQLLKMAQEVDNETYFWKAGKMTSKYGLKITYLIGYPIQ